MNFLLLDRSEVDKKALEQMISSCLDPPPPTPPIFYSYETRDVFGKHLPKDIDAVFFTVNTMYDVEAARHFNKVYDKIPIVAVSDSEQYCIEFYRFNTKDYLVRPITVERLKKALCLCELRNNGDIGKVQIKQTGGNNHETKKINSKTYGDASKPCPSVRHTANHRKRRGNAPTGNIG